MCEWGHFRAYASINVLKKLNLNDKEPEAYSHTQIYAGVNQFTDIKNRDVM